jgi:hypothetical protein
MAWGIKEKLEFSAHKDDGTQRDQMTMAMSSGEGCACIDPRTLEQWNSALDIFEWLQNNMQEEQGQVASSPRRCGQRFRVPLQG